MLFDWFFNLNECFVLIVLNLFYIVLDEMVVFLFEVCDWELYLVLIDGGDGLVVYCVICVGVLWYLCFGGWLMVEIGLM